MFLQMTYLRKTWILISTNYFVMIFAWTGDIVTLKDLGEKEFLRIKGTFYALCIYIQIRI